MWEGGDGEAGNVGGWECERVGMGRLGVWKGRDVRGWGWGGLGCGRVGMGRLGCERMGMWEGGGVRV